MSSDSHAAPKHPYHLVDPSPWPFFGALAAGVLATGLVLYMKAGFSLWAIAPGTIGILAIMAVWFRDVAIEATYKGNHTLVVQLGMRYGMALFIASEVMFFSAFFWAFFDASLFPKEATGGVWPPKGVHAFDPWDLPFLNTLILLLSGTTVTWAHHCLIENDRPNVKKALWITVLLGVAFTACQAYEYSHAAFGFKDGIYPSTFFMATGFHGFHVLVGTIFLAVTLMRVYKGHFTPTHHFGFEAAAWYWHFVDVVWLFLFICVYWWGGGSAIGPE